MRNIMHVRNFIIAVTIGLAMSYAAYPDDAPYKNADAKSANGAALTTGELRNVDKDTGKVTNQTGPIQNLDMSAASI